MSDRPGYIAAIDAAQRRNAGGMSPVELDAFRTAARELATVTPIRETGYLVRTGYVPPLPEALKPGWVVIETWALNRDEDWISSYTVGPVIRETGTFIVIEVLGEPVTFPKTHRTEIRGPGR